MIRLGTLGQPIKVMMEMMLIIIVLVVIIIIATNNSVLIFFSFGYVSTRQNITHLVSANRQGESSVLWKNTSVHRVDVGHEQKREPYYNYQQRHKEAAQAPFTYGPILLSPGLHPGLHNNGKKINKCKSIFYY